MLQKKKEDSSRISPHHKRRIKRVWVPKFLIKDGVHMCLMAKNASSSEDENYSKIESYYLQKIDEILEVMEDIHVIELGNSRNPFVLREKAMLDEDNDDILQELDILEKSYKEKDKLLADFKDSIEKLNHDEKILKEAIKVSRAHMQEKLRNLQRERNEARRSSQRQLPNQIQHQEDYRIVSMKA